MAMSKVATAVLLSTTGAQDLFEASKPEVSSGLPTLDMKNAALPGMKFPMMGLGVEGHGWELGQKMECWHWPQCCTKDHCPSINSVAAFIKTAVAQGGIARIDTGYPYGDNASGGCPKSEDDVSVARFLRGTIELNSTSGGGHRSCDTHGIGLGIKQSGAKRSDIFISAKIGYAGPMGKTNRQTDSLARHLGVDYLDLCMVHFPEVGPGTGSHGQYGKDSHCVPTKSDYSAKGCRLNTYRNMLGEMKAGRCKSVGVHGWDASELQEIADAKLELPSVIQYKFHAHQSSASKIQKDLLSFTEQHGIIFNGIAPLAAPDWVTFIDKGMTTTILEEPVVNEIAKKMGKTPAQVLLRWVTQQNVATQARTMSQEHMKANLDIFDFELSSEDMGKLSGMPQCNVTRGNPYAKGDPNGGPRHDHVVSLTEHC